MLLAAAESVSLTDLPALWDAYRDTILGWILNAGAAAAILILGLWIAGGIRGFIRKRIAANPKIDPTLGGFVASIVYYLAVAFVVIAVLNRFGVQTTSLVAMLGAATLAVGLALQGTLGNVAAGVMVVLFRPYKLGDYVEVAGAAGTVKDINIFTTELATPDNVQIILPNGLCWGAAITNYSAHPDRRCDITFGISYDDDIAKAMDVILKIAEADDRFLNTPAEPWVRVVNLGDSSVDLQLRAWLKAGDYWEAKFATIKAVKEAFDAAGIEIPYPHQVEIRKTAAE
jgi:small conductance mechanosensitive channel